MTLAYLFFHRAANSLAAGTYEDALRRFHATLAAAPPVGFLGSTTYRVGDGYCDWYLVGTSAALDRLNEAAVSGARGPAHDAAARMAADGAGKLLQLHSGEPDLVVQYEIRFSKPAGTGYAELYRQLEPWTEQPGASLWRRMMVLGPPPEFCLVSASPVQLPAEMNPEVISREPL